MNFTKIYSLIFLLLLSTIALISSCEKPKVALPVNAGAKNQSAVVILNDNSGFDSVLNILTNTAGVGSLSGDLGLYNFTVENNTLLNFVWYSWFPTQQNDLYSNSRLTYNMVSKSYQPLPSGANAIIPNINNQDKVSYSYFFKPYSNFFTYCGLSEKSSGIFSRLYAEYGGDISSTIPSTPNGVIGEPDMGYLAPMMNTQRFPGAPSYDERVGCSTSGAPNTVNLYMFRNCNPYKFVYQYSTNPTIPKIVANFLDLAKPLGLPKMKTYTFDLRSDSLFANYVKDSTLTTTGYVLQILEKVTGIAVASGLTNNSNIKTIRHYSTDGKIIGMFFQDLATKKCWTYSFDYSTNTFTKGMEGILLDYSAAGSDNDIDEFGNVYYSGLAGNGTNAVGVSIYKKSINGSSSLVGADNFLKFGEIISLKFLFGKVYMAVKGNITGTTIKQLTFLKQQ